MKLSNVLGAVALSAALLGGNLAATSAQARGRVALGSVSVDGPVSVAEARRVLGAAQRAFQQCYDDRLRERASLSGRTITRIFVSSDGGPIVAQVDQSDVGDPDLERCIKSAAMVLAFSEHESADSHVRFELRFGDVRRPSGEAHTVTAGPEDPRFRAGGGPEAAGPPASLRAAVGSEVVAASGARTAEQIATGLRRAEPRLLGCYERSLVRDRALEGEVRVRFAVDARGRTSAVLLEHDGVGDEALARCVRDVVTSTRFVRVGEGASEVVAKVTMRPPQGLTATAPGPQRP